ncbi:MAG TPA: hypothetical protein VKE42_02285, partial [Candidatus Cybelea sp.]|nr:hypothetical protein [Candidatus Cybelea sp.]
EVRALCAAHDRMMAEHREETARRDAASNPPVRKPGPGGLLYRDGPENAQASVAAMDGAPFIDESGSEAYPPLADLRRGIAQFVVTWCNRKLVARDRKIAELEGELREVKGMLAATLQLLGKSKSADVVELPERKRHA